MCEHDNRNQETHAASHKCEITCTCAEPEPELFALSPASSRCAKLSQASLTITCCISAASFETPFRFIEVVVFVAVVKLCFFLLSV